MMTRQPRRGSEAKAERRILVQLSVVAVSMATLAISWLGISAAERGSAAQPLEGESVLTSQSLGGAANLVPAPQPTGAGSAIRRSRAS